MIEALQNPSLIKGLLRELSVLKMPAQLITDGISREVLANLPDDQDRAAGTAFVLSSDSEGKLPSRGTFCFQLDGHYYQADVVQTGRGENTFQIPDTLTIVKRRRTNRTATESISKSPLLAEISREAFRATGLLLESDDTHTVLDLGQQVVPLTPDTKVRVRAFAEGKEILHHFGRVSAIRTSHKSLIIVVAAQADSTAASDSATLRPQRNKIEQGVQLTFHWPTKDGLSFALQLEDTSTFGAAGILIGSNERSFPPVGAICELDGMGLRAKLIWREQNRAGFDFRYNEKAQLGSWFEISERWTRHSLVSLPAATAQKRILSMMLRSGYLKGKRVRPLETLRVPTLLPILEGTGTWIRRFTGSSNQIEVDTHLSLIKVSDYSWLIQELGHSSQAKGLGEQILTSAIRDFYFQEAPHLRPRDAMIALYDPASHFNQRFWESRKTSQGAFFSEAWVVDLTTSEATIDAVDHVRITLPTQERWPEQFDALKKHHAEPLLYALGLGADSYASESLRERLNKCGLEHTRNVLLLETANGPAGFVAQLGLPPFSNLTGLSEALWIGLPPGCRFSTLLDTLRKDPGGQGILMGATDAIVFSADMPASARLFHFQAIRGNGLLQYLDVSGRLTG
ncbi:MAG: hypothetical protein A2X94_10425 [Bdellovibrionales bacterium GWB1_55_8]|nr:MAG: hypothetical protein A2X94_10425 [Bdellovibrionales bacterium GWB1_55_8]